MDHRLAVLVVIAGCFAGAAGAGEGPPGGPPRTVEECDEAVRQQPRSHGAWFCYRQLADAWGRGFVPLVAHLEQRLASHPADHMNELYLALLELNAQQNDKAEPLLRKAADGFHAEGDQTGEGKAQSLLVAMLCRDRRFADATPEVRRLELLAEASTDPELRADAWLRANYCYFYRSDLGRSLAYLHRAEAEVQRIPPSPRAALLQRLTLDGLGGVYSVMGRHREAYEVMQRALAIATTDIARAETRHRLAYEGMHLADEGVLDWAEVDRLIRASLDMEAKVGRPYLQVYETRILLALRAWGTPVGRKALEEAVAYGRQQYPHTAIIALRLLAKMEFDLSPAHPEQPLALLDESLALTRQNRVQLEDANGMLMKAYIRFRTGPRPQAIEEAQAALAEFDRLRDLQPEAMVRAFTSAETAYAHELVAGYLLDPAHGPSSPADANLAFQIIEGRRARALLGALMAARALVPPPGPLRVRRDELRTALSSTQKALLSPALVGEDRERALAELIRLESASEVLRDDLARETAEGPLLRVPPPTLAMVQAQLAPEEALLSFQTWRRQHTEDSPFDDGSSWVLTVTRDAVRATRIPDEEVLRERGAMLRAAIAGRAGAEVAGVTALHRELLAGALLGLPATVTRLIVVPDGPLNALPLGALRDARTGQPLAARYAISIAPSAALWLRWSAGRTEPGAAERGMPLALVLADPAIADGSASRQAAAGSTTRDAAVWVQGLGLPALPFARREASSISRELGGAALVLLGADASEHFLKQADLHPYRALHLAAHAVVDEDRPERSAVVLAPGAPEEDGLLQMQEVADLDLAGKLVVLAACRSSSGAILAGEGPLSLARSFFQAGSPAVVASLWPLRDDEAASMMAGFYRALAEGQPAAAALARVQREHLAAGAPTAAWAGLIMLGDGAFALVPPGRPVERDAPVARVVVVAVLLAGALTLLVWRRRRVTPPGGRPAGASDADPAQGEDRAVR
jgi:tetratricopeptide (TPR) repeat protein